MIGPVALAFGRAVWSQFHYRMLTLTILPFILALVLWGVALWFGLQPLIDLLQGWFAGNSLFGAAGAMLSTFGMGALKAVIVPLLAIWLLLPLMIVSVLVFVGALAMPAIGRHVAQRDYAGLERRRGGSLLGSVWVGLSGLCIFVALWFITLPLAFLPPLGLFIQALLWGWLAARVMAYDALADFADAGEYRQLVREHRWALLAIGVATGAMGAVPTLFGLGIVLFPPLALPSLWLYVLAFVFAGLWFQHYCLAALARMRAQATQPAPAGALKDINPL